MLPVFPFTRCDEIVSPDEDRLLGFNGSSAPLCLMLGRPPPLMRRAALCALVTDCIRTDMAKWVCVLWSRQRYRRSQGDSVMGVMVGDGSFVRLKLVNGSLAPLTAVSRPVLRSIYRPFFSKESQIL